MSKKIKNKLEILKGKRNHYWRIEASNGRLVGTSGEDFSSKSNAKRAYKNVIKKFSDYVYVYIVGEEEIPTKKTRIEVYMAKDNWRWHMKASNNKIIAHSGESFNSKRNAINGAKAFSKIASDDKLIVDDNSNM